MKSGVKGYSVAYRNDRAATVVILAQRLAQVNQSALIPFA
jgi:hypothetical protein